MNVLVVAAHPDDEVLGCGGSIARLAKEGHNIHIAILGEGITSRYTKREEAQPKLVKELHKNCERVAKKLSAKSVSLYSLPDNRFDTIPLLDVVKIVEALVKRLKPQVVYTHHGGDLNIDHAITSRATLTATRPLAGSPIKELYAFEVPSSTEWGFGGLEPLFRPNTFVNISKTLEKKIQAMQLYEGEMQAFPHPRSADALRAIATRWGSCVGVVAAEAFELIRAVQ